MCVPVTQSPWSTQRARLWAVTTGAHASPGALCSRKGGCVPGLGQVGICRAQGSAFCRAFSCPQHLLEFTLEPSEPGAFCVENYLQTFLVLGVG